MAKGGAASAALAAFLTASVPARGAEIVVAPSGGDYASIQAALDSAVAGDTVVVLSGTYREAPVFPRSGSATSGYITLRAGPGETAVIDPQAGVDVVTVEDRSWVRIVGFEIANSHAGSGAGIMVRGRGDRIEIANNRIHGLSGTDAVGIMVVGDDPVPLSRIVVSGNEIHDCEPAPSEALVLNGNVSGFEVVDNVVHDVNNIGLDFIGGESWTGNHGVARDGVCRGNRVYRARSVYGGGYAAGIYVDGGRDIVLERNLVHECDLGIEIGAENAGYTVTGVIVRNNVVYANDKAGIVFGGYEAELGRVDGCEFSGNTLYHNDTLADGNGEFAVNWAEGNRVRNNIVVAGPQNLLLRAETGSVDNVFDWNLYYAAAGAAAVAVDWKGTRYTGFEQYRAAVGQDLHSGFADPLLESPGAGAVRLAGGSPALDAGDMESPDLLGAADYYGNPRVRGGRVDIGAAEADILPGAGSGDYDGDGTADVAVFRPSSGAWLVRGLTRAWYGGAGDLPVPRDYSGDGTWDFAVFRPASGKWMARGTTAAFYGVSADLPVPADYDGDGRADFAVFRPAAGKWLVRDGLRVYYGVSTDVAVPGDYDGDGTADVAVFRPAAGKWLVREGSRAYYGTSADTVAPGDYDGDGTWDFAVFRPPSGRWSVKDGPAAYWGEAGDAVQPADYDGDGTWDFAVFRPAAGKWLLRGRSAVFYGASTDVPVTNP